MTLSGLFLLEISLWMDEGAHVISMAKRFLGNPGRIVAWTLISSSARIHCCLYRRRRSSVNASLPAPSRRQSFKAFCSTLFLSCFRSSDLFRSPDRWAGQHHSIYRINCCLFCASGLGIDHVQSDLLFQRQWTTAWMAVRSIFDIFQFPNHGSESDSNAATQR